MISDPLHRALALWGVATAIAAATLMHWVDIPVALFFYAHRETAWVAFFAAITDFANGFIWYSLCLIGIAVATVRHGPKAKRPNPVRKRQEIRAWLFMIASMASSGIFINAMKFAFGRQRPKFLFDGGTNDFLPFGGVTIADSSFPSGHTQSIWTAMLSLAFLFPPLRPLFLVIATVVAMSRIVVGAHYLADVVTSIFIAFATVLLWRRWFTKDGLSVTLIESRSVKAS
ncbi:MAG: phosphatase PAP2 family protein [Proteobacteria bacterium]|nr:phosphatase PAP2 family protein [Pseudomonadota bacterium]